MSCKYASDCVSVAPQVLQFACLLTNHQPVSVYRGLARSQLHLYIDVLNRAKIAETKQALACCHNPVQEGFSPEQSMAPCVSITAYF